MHAVVVYLSFHLSVCACVSVTLRYCVKTAKRSIMQIMPHDRPGTLVTNRIFCTVVVEFLLTSASRGLSAIAELLVQVFVWRSSKGCCYGNQLNMGDVRKRRVEWPLFFASTFDNRLADRKSAFNRFNGNNQGTSFPNLVNFRPTISEFSLLKRAVFAAICPPFDDDLHSSRWRLQTDWRITILILAK